jgi:hypothetical protein
MRRSLDGSGPGLVSLYHFDEGSGSVTSDGANHYGLHGSMDAARHGNPHFVVSTVPWSTTSPNIELSELALDLGSVAVGFTGQASLKVRNTGADVLVVSGIVPDDPLFTASPETFSLQPGGIEDVLVSFLPTTLGPSATTLSISSNDPVNPVLSVSVSGTARSAEPVLRVFSFDTTRAGALSPAEGAEMSSFREALQASFTIEFQMAPQLTATALSQADIVFLSAVKSAGGQIDPLSEPEQALLVDYVKSGGTAILVGDNQAFAAASSSLLGPFGMSMTGAPSHFTPIAVADPDAHPTTNGPFGRVAGIDQWYPGRISDGGSHGVALASDVGGAGMVVIEPGDLDVGSGPVVAFADHSFDNKTLTDQNLDLLLNVFAYLSDPPDLPTSTPAIRLSATSLDFGPTPLREPASLRLTLENVSGGDITVDGVFIEDEAQFTLVGQLAVPFVIPSGLTKALTFDFEPRFPGAQSSLLQIRIGSPSLDTLTVSLVGEGTTDAGIPTARIKSVTPESPVTWDSTTKVVLSGDAFDNDQNGQSIDRFAWLLESGDTLKVSDEVRDYDLQLQVSSLPVGEHRLTFRVWDNEGDSSEASTVLVILGVTPVAHIDSAHVDGQWSRKVTLREGLDTFVLYGSDSDGDEFGESVASRSWTFGSESDHYSLRREVGSAQTLSIAPDRLGLGKHRVYYHVTDDEGVVSEPDSIQVIVRGRFGRAIIVAGGDLELRQRYSSRVANQVYDALIAKRRFEREDVVYLNQLDGWNAWWKNVQVTDREVSVARLGAEIEDARRDNIELNVPLLIFLAGHGGVREFQLSEGEILQADVLKAWLDGLVQAKAAFRGIPVEDLPADEIVVVVDFCFSRTFLEVVSGPGRVVIGSSSEERALVIDGTSFAEAFFRWLSRGGDEANLWRSFEEASAQVQSLFSQSPYMDVDGDGVSLVDERGNIMAGQEAGVDLALGMFVGGELGGRALPLAEDAEIHSVTFSDMGLGRVAFEVKADPGLTGLGLSLVILPESGPLPDADGEGTVRMAAAEPAAGDTVLYRGEVQFAQSGDYTVAILGTDDLGNFAGHVQQRITVQIGPIGDFDGDGEVGFQDFIVFAQVYGSAPDDDGWDSRFDLNGDGQIGFQDFVMFAQAYGH